MRRHVNRLEINRVSILRAVVGIDALTAPPEHPRFSVLNHRGRIIVGPNIANRSIGKRRRTTGCDERYTQANKNRDCGARLLPENVHADAFSKLASTEAIESFPNPKTLHPNGLAIRYKSKRCHRAFASW